MISDKEMIIPIKVIIQEVREQREAIVNVFGDVNVPGDEPDEKHYDYIDGVETSLECMEYAVAKHLLGEDPIGRIDELILDLYKMIGEDRP